MNTNLRNSLLLTAILIATALVYWTGLHGDFVLDDYLFIVTNPDLHIHALSWQQLRTAMLTQATTPVPRPLSYASFALNFYFTGLDPFWMKLTNVVIHLGNGVLLFGLLREVLAASRGADRDQQTADRIPWLALLVTTAWLLAPINLTAVLYVYQRVESAANLFVFAGLWLYATGRRGQLSGKTGGVWHIAVGLLGCGAIGILFKEDAALLPLYAFLLEWIVFRFRDGCAGVSRGMVAFYVVLLLPAITGTVGILHWVMKPTIWAIRDFNLEQRLLTEPRVVIDYMHWTLFPSLNQLSFYHDDMAISRSLLSPPWTLLAIVGVLCAIGLVFLLRKRKPLVALGIAWFLAAQVMTGTVIPLELVFEHRNYFASAGLLLAFFAAIASMKSSRTTVRARFALLLILVIFYAGTTSLRVADWSNPLRLAWSQTERNPASARARFQLGYTLVGMSEYRGDSKLLAMGMASLKQAAKMPGASILPEETLIYTAYRTRPAVKVDPAWWMAIQYKLRHQPFGPEDLIAIDTLTKCTIERVCAPDASNMVPLYLIAIQRSPKSPQILILYANYAVSVLGDLKLARNLLAGAVLLEPRNSNYQRSLRELEAEIKSQTITPKPTGSVAARMRPRNR